MAYAQPAYRMDAVPAYAPSRQGRSTRRPDVRVVPGTRGRSSESGTPSLILVARMLAIVCVVLAIVCCARIALTSATVTKLLESDALSAQITEARSTGTSLEMQQSVLASTPHINSVAKKYKMATPYEVGTIALEADIVATDGEGNLSLSDTVKNVVGTQE